MKKSYYTPLIELKYQSNNRDLLLASPTSEEGVDFGWLTDDEIH